MTVAKVETAPSDRPGTVVSYSPEVRPGRLTTHESACSCRLCRIETLLENLDVVTDSGPGTSGNDGACTPQMSPEWHSPAYRELRRVLALMDAGRRTQRLHMLAYFSATRRMEKRHVNVRGPQGRNIKATVDVSVRLTPHWVQLSLVRDAVRFVEDKYRGDPSLPASFLKAA